MHNRFAQYQNPLMNLKKVFSMLMRLLNRNKKANVRPSVSEFSDKEHDPMHAEILSVADDEYARILEDLELMANDEYARILRDLELLAEERIKTLIEASNRDLKQQESDPMQSVHPIAFDSESFAGQSLKQ